MWNRVSRYRFDITFNWATVFAFVLFWCYGFYGAITWHNEWIQNVPISIVLCCALSFFIVVAKYNQLFAEKFQLSGEEILLFLAYLLFLFVVTQDSITKRNQYRTKFTASPVNAVNSKFGC